MSLLTLFLISSLAFAAGDGGGDHHSFPKMEIIWHAVNLGILLSLLTFLLRGPIRDALANRSASVKKDIDESNRLRKEAQHRMEELDQRLSGFEAELGRMRTDAEADAAKEREAILARADTDAARVRESAERTIRDEIERARTSLRREAVELSIGLAREHLEARITSEDQERLTGDFLSLVKSGQEGSQHG